MRPYFSKLQIQITQKKRERLKQENLDHPDKQGPFSRGDPDEEDDDGDDKDDDDEENDSEPPSIEGISIGLENKLNYDLLSRYGMTIYHGSRTVQHLCFYNNVFST